VHQEPDGEFSAGMLDPKPAFTALVVDSKTTEEEVADAARLVASANPSTPLFLQPAFDGKGSAGGSYLIGLWQAARALLRDVRIVPQLHRQLGLE